MSMHQGMCDDNTIATSCYGYGVFARYGIGMSEDIQTARRYFNKACDGKNVRACYVLGVMHEEGIGGAANFATASDYYKKSCALDVLKRFPDACRILDAWQN